MNVLDCYLKDLVARADVDGLDIDEEPSLNDLTDIRHQLLPAIPLRPAARKGWDFSPVAAPLFRGDIVHHNLHIHRFGRLLVT